jgi:hypothetical protein
MDTIISQEESTHININGLPILFNVLGGKLMGVSNKSLYECVSGFVARWGIKENTENRFELSKKPLEITTPDKQVHQCVFVCESMIEGDTCITTNVCQIEGIEALKNDYLDEFDADIGSAEIQELITDAIMSDSDCESWPEFGFSFVLNEKEAQPCQPLRIV